MSALGKHLHVLLVALVNLATLQNLERYGTVLVVSEERATAGLTHILHHAADAHRAVQLLLQVDHEFGILQVLDVGLAAAEVTLHKADDFLQLFVVVLTFVERLQVSESLLLERHEHTGDDLLVIHRVLLQTVGHYVVDVLDEDHVGIDVVQVLNQRAMASGTEQQRTVLVAERSVVGIGSHGICAGLLLREGDVVLDAVLLCEHVLLLSHLLLEELDVLVAHGEVHVGLAVAGSIERTLHEMLLHRRAGTLGILVEEQHALRQLTVVQAFLVQHVGHHSLVVALSHQLLHALAVIGLALLVQRPEESEVLDAVEVFLLKVGGRHVIVGIQEAEHILEHAAGSTRSGHELHDFAPLGLIGIPGIDILFPLCLVGSHDTMADAGGSLQAEERETCFKLFQLNVNLLRGDTLLGDLL